MNCKEAEGWLDAYHDGELHLPAAIDLEQHLSNCHACALSLENKARAGSQIRAAAFKAPDQLAQNIRAALQSQPLSVNNAVALRGGHLRIDWKWSAAAAAVVCVGLILSIFRPESEAVTIDEITDSHIRSLIGNHLVDVASSDQHTVRPWFEGKVDFAPAVPDLTSKGFEIIGGRLDYIAGHAAASLVYQHRKHFISLFLWPNDGEAATSQAIKFEKKAAQRGYHILHWHGGGMNCWAVSEISDDELHEFGQFFANSTLERQ